MNKPLFLLFLLWTSSLLAQVDSTATIRPTKPQKNLLEKDKKPSILQKEEKSDSLLVQDAAAAQADADAVEDVGNRANPPVTDSLKKKWNAHIFVGVDLYQPILTAFTDKTSFGAYLQVPVYKKWNAVLEGGYESLLFDDLGWNVEGNGFFARLGANWFFSVTEREPFSGFYTGFRVAYSQFDQTINDFPIRGLTANGEPSLQSGGSLGQESGSAVWVEPLAGGRVKLFDTNFYADISVRLQLLVSETNGHNIDALTIPGYGLDTGNFSGTILWGVGYRF